MRTKTAPATAGSISSDWPTAPLHTCARSETLMSVAPSEKCVVSAELWLLAPAVNVLYHMTSACTVTAALEHRKGCDTQN